MDASKYGNRIRVRHRGRVKWAKFSAMTPFGIHATLEDCNHAFCSWTKLTDGAPTINGSWCWPESDPSVCAERKALP